MTLPAIHPNGDRRDTLVSGLRDASEALDLAYAALKRTAPNGRNYYPQGPDAYGKARDEHDDRMRRLDAVKDEVDALMMAIHEMPG